MAGISQTQKTNPFPRKKDTPIPAKAGISLFLFCDSKTIFKVRSSGDSRFRGNGSIFGSVFFAGMEVSFFAEIILHANPTIIIFAKLPVVIPAKAGISLFLFCDSKTIFKVRGSGDSRFRGNGSVFGSVFFAGMEVSFFAEIILHANPTIIIFTKLPRGHSREGGNKGSFMLLKNKVKIAIVFVFLNDYSGVWQESPKIYFNKNQILLSAVLIFFVH